MNFQRHFREGRQGRNIGLSTGIKAFTRALRGIQRKRIYGIGAAPKVGKTKLTDYCFVLSPYEQMLAENRLDDIEWIYWSLEVDRIQKEFDFAAHYFARDYGIYNYMHNGKLYGMSSSYLMGQELDEKERPIQVSDEHMTILIKIYQDKIIPLFGEFDETGKQIRRGKIIFIRESDNPTGLRNFLLSLAKRNGEFITEKYKTHDSNGKDVIRERISGYRPKNPDKYWIIITDHIRKLKPERNFNKKETVDKWIEYQVELRDWCSYTFVDIIHMNRGLGSTDRLKFSGEFIYPTGDDAKDTGNLSEDADYFITLFNPNDEKYRLDKHFGVDLEGYPHYRSIHIVESRHTECPIHIQTNMFGGITTFEGLNDKLMTTT